VSVAASGRLVKFGLAGLSIWCALAAASLWPIRITAGEAILLEVARAESSVDARSGDPIINVTLKESSKQIFAEITQNNVGRTMELRVDGKVVMAPVVREPLLGGQFQISGSLSASEANNVAARLSAGGRIEIEVVSQ